MKLMSQHSSAIAHEDTPHVTQSTQNELNNNISVAVKRRARTLINDKSIDVGARTLIRYALEINDPYVAELVRRADAGEVISETLELSAPSDSNEDGSGEERLEILTEMICRAGDEPAIKSAALLVLMTKLENATHPKAMANVTKHLAFSHCGELNLCGMVDAQAAMLEAELMMANTFIG